MNKLDNTNNTTTTENGMPTYASSLDAMTDLFFKAGASRGKDIVPDFKKAYNEDAFLAARLSLWLRDVRGGAGERQLFKDVVSYMIAQDPAIAERVMHKIPELGRWDDMYVYFGTQLENQALRLIASALRSGDGLCAKWMDRKGPNFNKVRKYLKMTPREYRTLLVTTTDVVEQKMCAKQWSEIDYNKLPSVASARYQKAFGRNDSERYTQYIQSLEKGTGKVNASAVYPYDVIKSLRYGNESVADAQWASLPNFLKGSTESILPLVDVSGSMDAPVGGTKSVTCMDVAVSLGLYLSERSEGKFKDAFITFSERPQLEVVSGTLKQRFNQMVRSQWSMTTNFEAAFDLILKTAVKNQIPESEMPTMLLVLSDMQFNEASRGHQFAYQMIEDKYEKAGYKAPKIVYWNLRASTGVPVQFNKEGAALISGFSPSIMSSVLGVQGDEFSPRTIMLKTLHNPRYDFSNRG